MKPPLLISRTIYVVAMVSLLMQSASAAEPFAYKGFTPGQMTFEEFRLQQNPQADNDFRSEPRPIRCGPAKPGTGTMFCAESSGDFLTWLFVDGILASVYTTFDRNDFKTVLKLFSDKYDSSYVVAPEVLHDENGRAIEGYHTYTWTKDDRQIILWEFQGSPDRSFIMVKDKKLSEKYDSRVKHVSI